MTTLPIGGRAVLLNIASKRSVWHGWDADHAANTSEGRDAYAARAAAILACRQCGLITQENHLTDSGRAVVKAIEEALLG